MFFFFQGWKVLFRVFFVEDLKKIIKVILYSEQLFEIEGVRLENIFGIKLWEVCVNILCSEWNIKYYYCIIFDLLVKINFGFFGKVMFVEKIKEFRIVLFYDFMSFFLII